MPRLISTHKALARFELRGHELCLRTILQTIRFEPSVTSSALVDLRYNGLGDRAETVVGGFTNDSLTYVRFDLDRR